MCDPRGLPADQVSRIENRLSVINEARRIEDIDVAGFKLHPLHGEYAGFHAVWSHRQLADHLPFC